MKKIITILFVCFSPFASSLSFTKSQVSTQKCQVYFDESQQKVETVSTGGQCRVVLEDVPTGLYLIQDFHTDSMTKATDPYLIHDLRDIYTFTPASIEGNLVIYHPDGHKLFDIPYFSGKENGPVILWHKNGNKASEISFSNGQREGLARSWYENGILESEGYHKDNHSDGEWRYWDKDENLIGVEFYVDGRANGQFVQWYANGKEKSIISYKDDIIISCKFFDETGNLKYQGVGEKKCAYPNRPIM